MKIIKIMSITLLVFCMPANAASGWKGPEAWVAEEIRQKFTLSALYQCQIPRIPESNNIWKLTFSLMASQEEHPYLNIILVNVSESTCLGGDLKPDMRGASVRDLFDEVCPFIRNLQERLGKGRSSVDTTKDHWVRDQAPIAFCICSEPLVTHRSADGKVLCARIDNLYDRMMRGETSHEDYEQLRSYEPRLIGTILITSKEISTLEVLAGYFRTKELLFPRNNPRTDYRLMGTYTCFNNRAFNLNKPPFFGCLAVIWGGVLLFTLFSPSGLDWDVELSSRAGPLGLVVTGIWVFLHFFFEVLGIDAPNDSLLL